MTDTCSAGTDIGPTQAQSSAENLEATVQTDENQVITTKVLEEARVLPTEEILQKFIDEEQELSSADYTKRFYLIRLEQDALRQEQKYSSLSACNPCHYMRNRYRDILPYDHNRVILNFNEDNIDGYMNASLIKLEGGQTQFIAAQAPLSATLAEWWQMIYEQQVDLIIMLCKLIEMSKVKCERYWPENIGESLIFGHFEITLQHEERFSDNDYLLRVLKMENAETGKTRSIRQLHYIEWPDHGCPSGEEQLLNMIEKMAEIHINKNAPVLVHCSAGVGRTGTIIAVNHIRELLSADTLTEINLYELVMTLRKQRASMVQTQDQYQFVHKCVARYARRRLGIPDPVPVKETDSDTPESTKDDKFSDVSDNDEGTNVPDFPNEPPAPKGPEPAEELGSAAN